MLRHVVLINCYIPPIELFTEHFTNKLVFEAMAHGDALPCKCTVFALPFVNHVKFCKKQQESSSESLHQGCLTLVIPRPKM